MGCFRDMNPETASFTSIHFQSKLSICFFVCQMSQTQMYISNQQRVMWCWSQFKHYITTLLLKKNYSVCLMSLNQIKCIYFLYYVNYYLLQRPVLFLRFGMGLNGDIAAEGIGVFCPFNFHIFHICWLLYSPNRISDLLCNTLICQRHGCVEGFFVFTEGTENNPSKGGLYFWKCWRLGHNLKVILRLTICPWEQIPGRHQRVCHQMLPEPHRPPAAEGAHSPPCALRGPVRPVELPHGTSPQLDHSCCKDMRSSLLHPPALQLCNAVM